MTNPKAAWLTHVGIHAWDVAPMLAFYTDVMGLEISDSSPELGLYFLSADSEEEHHQLIIAHGRTAPADAVLVNQISFRCRDLPMLLAYHERFRRYGVTVQATMSHGNAFSIYAFDPEGNRIEIYWNTGLGARQPFGVGIDLDQDIETIVEQNRELVSRHGETGFANLSLRLPAARIP